MKRAIKYVLILIAVVVVYLGVSMLRTKGELQEELPFTLTLDSTSADILSGVDPAMEEALKNGDSTSADIQSGVDPAMEESLKSGDSTSADIQSGVDPSMEEELKDGDSSSADIGTGVLGEPTEVQAIKLSSGQLQSRGAYSSSGNISVVKESNGKSYLYLEDVKISKGPDLRVWFSADEAGSNFVDLGPLKANSGTFFYELPADVNPANFNTVIIRCRAFATNFGVGGLK